MKTNERTKIYTGTKGDQLKTGYVSTCEGTCTYHGTYVLLNLVYLGLVYMYPYIFSYVRSCSHVRLAGESDVRSEQALRSGCLALE